MNKAEWLQYFENIHQNTDLDVIDRFALANRMNLKHREVLPSFFAGDITAKNKILLLSINPGYSEGKTEKEQSLPEQFDSIQNIGYADWFEKCRDRFNYYEEIDEKLHVIFHCFYNWLVPFSERTGKTKDPKSKRFLQNEVVNIDYFPYYSQSTPTIHFHQVHTEFPNLSDLWLGALKDVIYHSKPRFVFLHGGTEKYRWFLKTHTTIDLDIQDPELSGIEAGLSRGRTYQIYRGDSIFGIKCPVLYLNNFINKCGQVKNRDLVFGYLKEQGLV